MIEIASIIGEIKTLEPLPPTAVKLVQLIGDDRSSVDEIGRVIEYDQALTAYVLKYANSVFSGSKRKIVSVKDAVIRIGAARITEQIVANHLQPKLKSPLIPYGYDESDLWRHSVAAATAAEMISSCTDVKISAASFTAALLHDIGKLIICRLVRGEDADNIWKMMTDRAMPCPGERAEKSVIGFSHAQIGAHIATEWGLPQPIVCAIRDHHEPSSEDLITDTVKIANVAARSIGEGLGSEGMSLAIDDNVARRMHLTHDSFENLCAKTLMRFKEVLLMFDS
jgi:putative nucleotidyltransferase with HDIG domain